MTQVKNTQEQENYYLEIYGKAVTKKSKNHICFDGMTEYFSYGKCILKADRSNVIDIDSQVRSGSSIVATHEQTLEIRNPSSLDSIIIDYLKNLKATEVTENVQLTNVPGVGNIPKIECDRLKVGMYLFYSDCIYTISNVEKLEFINHATSHIVTVANLINAIDYKKIILHDELVTAWQVNFESVNQIKVADTALPKTVRPPTHDRGIKGKGREMFIKMLSSGATLDQVASSFNWSQKVALDQLSYVKSWGYNLKQEDGVYQVV